MTLDFQKILDEIDEEVDIYSFKNSLDEKTTEELRFVANSFVKYLKKNLTPNKDFLEVLVDFDKVVDAIESGIMGTGFETNASQLYRNLPTVKNLYEQYVSEIKTEKEDLLKKLEESKKELSKLMNKIESSKPSGSSSKPKPSSKPSYSSYGGCSSGGSIRSYGRC